MWILPKQLHISPYVPDMKALGLDCEEFGRMSEKSLMWRSKPSQSRTWCQRWKRVKYMKLLSGRILKPSHSSSFVDTLLSCQPDSPVSRLVLLEDETQQKIQDIYTHISPKESPYASQITLFSKTSKESSAVKQPMENRYSNMSSETWKKEVTVQRGEYSARLKQVRHINEKESLSWPTARNSDAEGGRIETEMSEKGFRSKRHKSDQYFGAKLRDAVETHEEKSWRTPTTEGEAGRRGLGKATCKELRAKNRTITLTRQVRDTENKNWPTPRAGNPGSRKKGTGGKVLNEEVKNWPTPTTQDTIEHKDMKLNEKGRRLTKDGKDSHSVGLGDQVKIEKNWPTPTSTERSGTNPKTGKGGGLSKQAKEQSWPTPEVHTVEKYSLQKDGQKKTQRSKNLVAMAIKGELGLPDQEKSSTSGKSQESWGTPRQSMANSPTEKQIAMGAPKKKIEDQVAKESWPTPVLGEAHLTVKSEKIQKNRKEEGKMNLTRQASAGGKLNPNWVEQLMGLPLGWTQLPIEWTD